MNRKELSLDERKKLQLEMLKEIDAFCRKNNIKYALSCGTLIGAVRHKGFIPWDDDVDITMLFPDILKFRQLFKSENMIYCDIDTDPFYANHFPSIISKKTYSKRGVHKFGGVCIDLYPIIECTKDLKIIKKLVEQGQLLLKKRQTYIKWNYRLIKYSPFLFILPGYKNAIRNYYNYMINDVQTIGGGNYYQMGGPITGDRNNFYHNIWPFNPLKELLEVPFEDSSFYIPAKYHEFLTVRYGDYMKFPPEEERHPYHGQKYYWK